jgi:hypothetical protein
LEGGDEGLELELPGVVPFVERVFGGGAGEVLDCGGLVGEGDFGGCEDG